MLFKMGFIASKLKKKKKAIDLGDQAKLSLITSSPITSDLIFGKFLYYSGPQ